MWGWNGQHHQGKMNGGWRGGWHFNWWIPVAIFIFVLLISRGAWWVWFLIPGLFWFSGNWKRGWGHSEWGRGWEYNHDAAEKAKRDQHADWDDDEKPKRSPTYVMGDDGELREAPSSMVPRGKRGDDDIEYV
jgi:hypothetical protein